MWNAAAAASQALCMKSCPVGCRRSAWESVKINFFMHFMKVLKVPERMQAEVFNAICEQPIINA